MRSWSCKRGPEMLSWAAARSQRGASPAGTSPGRHKAARRDREKGDTSKSPGGWGTREYLAQEGGTKSCPRVPGVPGGLPVQREGPRRSGACQAGIWLPCFSLVPASLRVLVHSSLQARDGGDPMKMMICDNQSQQLVFWLTGLFCFLSPRQNVTNKSSPAFAY